MKLARKIDGLVAVLLITLLTASPVWAQEMKKTMEPMPSMMGQGMMGQDMTGQGMMGQDMMGQGMRGQGMMGHGMRGHGMMGHGMGGQGMMDPGAGARVVPVRHLSSDDVRHFLEHRLARHGNKRLKVGEVKELDDDAILAEIVTLDDSLVRRFKVDRHSGRMQDAEDTMKPMAAMEPMAGMMAADAPTVPPVTGYSEGEKVLFLHTETSDPEIAKILTDMMGSPVLVVPALAQAPKEMLARVYVFTNGLNGEGPLGPLGFQPDVFDSPPDKSGYSPLRTVVLTTWKDEASARLLTSAAEVQEALQNGELTTEEPGVVVNMPMVTWPGGRR
jgi:hypothetical protein